MNYLAHMMVVCQTNAEGGLQSESPLQCDRVGDVPAVGGAGTEFARLSQCVLATRKEGSLPGHSMVSLPSRLRFLSYYL